MAAEVSSMPVNGNYAPHQGYGGLEQQNNYAYGKGRNPASMSPEQPQSSSTPATSTSSAPPSKDEVGWYFVEQYYTTLSRSPDKVYLFYNKRSQFVSGQETDKVAVCVGQRDINDRMKELEFQDTKVRVTNVDSQASDNNIVIQVIGEISNKSQPHRKFVQTFILATQTNGYFVLNDIFRYLIDEEDETEEAAAPAAAEEVQQAPAAESESREPAPSAPEPEPKSLTSTMDPAGAESDAKQVDKVLEEKVLNEPAQTETASAGAVNGVEQQEEAKPEEEEPVTASEPPAAELSKTVTQEADLQPEAPKDPEPTPAASPPKQATPAPASAPSKPAVPKTWASLAASAIATPAAPSSNASSATSQQKPAQSAPKSNTPSAPSAQSSAPTPTAPAAQRDESPAAGSQDEWTAVGGAHNRQQSRQTNQPPPSQNRGYIPKVFEGVEVKDLRATLERFGRLSYFDVSRPKNCAFVDFETTEGYNAAIAANPHTVNGEQLTLEERRYRPQGAYPPRGNFQGGRGRGGPQGQGRGSFQGNRGGFAPRGGPGGRGGPGQQAPRGGATSQHT